MSLNQQVIAEFSPCTPSAPQLRDLSIQTSRTLSSRDTENDFEGAYVGGVSWASNGVRSCFHTSHM